MFRDYFRPRSHLHFRSLLVFSEKRIRSLTLLACPSYYSLVGGRDESSHLVLDLCRRFSQFSFYCHGDLISFLIFVKKTKFLRLI